MKRTSLSTAIALLVAATLPCLAQIATAPPTPEWIQAAETIANQTVIFQRTFEVKGSLLKAILLGACEGEMSVEVNGAAAGTITGREQATGLDLTDKTHPGANVLTVHARNPLAPPRTSIFIELNGDLARNSWIVTDS